jgi:hypothetical protein
MHIISPRMAGLRVDWVLMGTRLPRKLDHQCVIYVKRCLGRTTSHMRNAVIGDDDRRCVGGMAARDYTVAVRLLDSEMGGMSEGINTAMPSREC